MTVKTVTEKTFICDICNQEVEDFALPINREPAIRNIKRLSRNEIIDSLDVCQECSDKLIHFIDLVRREHK